MIGRSDFFSFRRKRWIQLSGSKNSQRGQMAEILPTPATCEGQMSLVEWAAGWQEFIPSQGYLSESEHNSTSIALPITPWGHTYI